MADRTPRLGLSWLMPAQAQKHVTVNETFGRLDALVHCVVRSREVGFEPEFPEEGDAYILPDTPTGAIWNHFVRTDLVYFQDGSWHQITPREGLLAWVSDEAVSLIYYDKRWQTVQSQFSSFENLQSVGVGTQADEQNPFTAKLNSALWTARYDDDNGSGDLRYTFNKQTSTKTLSIVFQTDWQGRAEIGLTGSDDLSFKVSKDGQDWNDALVLKSSKAKINLPNLPIDSAGLSSGDVWNDKGTLKIIP